MRLGQLALMGVLVMLVMDVAVLVLGSLMRVVVFMALSQMQPKAKRHQRAGDDELSRERLA